MGNTVSNSAGASSGKVLQWHFGKGHPISPAKSTAQAAAQQEDACLIELFLTSLGLTIYADAFLLAGYGSSSAASLAALTAADLARVQAVSKVPILQQHQDTILAAVHDFVQTQAAGGPDQAQPASGPEQGSIAYPAAATAAAGSDVGAPQQHRQQQQDAGDVLARSTAQRPGIVNGGTSCHGQSGLNWARCAALLRKSPARKKTAAPPLSNIVGMQGRHAGRRDATKGSRSSSGQKSRLQMAAGQHCPSPAAANAAPAATVGNEHLPAVTQQQQTVDSSSSSLQQPAPRSLSSNAAAMCCVTPDAAAASSNDSSSKQDQNMSAGGTRPQHAVDAAAAAAAAAPTQATLLLDRERGSGQTEPLHEQHLQQQQQAASEPSADAISPPHEHRRVLPGLSGIEPDDSNPFLQQLQPALATAGDAAASAHAAAEAGTAEGYWSQDLQKEHGCLWDDSNPFLDDDIQPVTLQPGYTGAAGSAHEEGNKSGSGGLLAAGSPAHLMAAPAAAGAAAGEAGQGVGVFHTTSTYAAAAVLPAACGVMQAAVGGPLTSQRSQLLRPSSRAAGGQRVLSNAAVTAAAAAKLAGRRKQTNAWEKLPGEIKGLSYAATASLKTNPLPALAAVASGLPRKSRVVDVEPGVLTVNACQLPSRPTSESGFSMHSQRYPGLRAEESAASTSAALQQLARQQASNQELICRLLQVPTTGAGTESEVAGFDDGAAAGPAMGHGSCIMVQGSAALLPEGSVLGASPSLLLLQQQPQLYAQHNSSSGSFLAQVSVAGLGSSMGQQQQQVLVLTQHGLAAAASEAIAAQGPATASGVLQLSDPLTQRQQHSPWHTQQQHQAAGAWQQSANTRASSAHLQQRQQGTLTRGAQHGYAFASAQPSHVLSGSHSLYGGDIVSHVAVQGVLGSSGALHRRPVQQQVLLGQQYRGVLLQESSSASVGPVALGSVSGAQSCMEVGARAADVSSIVQRAKAKAAAKQQQQQVDRSPVKLSSAAALCTSEAAEGEQDSSVAAKLPGMPRADAPAAALGATAAARASPGSSLAAAVRDGDRVLQMLQEYKELSELDKAVKCRMMQLMHYTAAQPSDVQGAQHGQHNQTASMAVAQQQQAARAGVDTATCATDAPAQSCRVVGDQSPARFLQGAQRKQSPARAVHGKLFSEQSMQSDQQHKLAGQHHSPSHAPIAYRGAAVLATAAPAAAGTQQRGAGGASAGQQQRQDACASTHSTARQLKMEDPVPGASAAGNKRARRPAAPTSAASVAGMAPGEVCLSADLFEDIAEGWQHANRSSVIALVAAVAARSAKK